MLPWACVFDDFHTFTRRFDDFHTFPLTSLRGETETETVLEETVLEETVPYNQYNQ
jgi:hypothetical protein